MRLRQLGRATQIRPLSRVALFLLDESQTTIRELAREVDVTNSAMSQTVSVKRAAGLESIPGPDARSRIVALTPAGRELVPPLRAEWASTERAIAELESEIPVAGVDVRDDRAGRLGGGAGAVHPATH
jgi:DNA-binding MarR family transcriptional regulator